MVKHAQTILCVTILWDWSLKVKSFIEEAVDAVSFIDSIIIIIIVLFYLAENNGFKEKRL